jgi:hypothetical protein
MKIEIATNIFKKGLLNAKTIIYSSYLILSIACIIVAIQLYVNIYKNFYLSISSFEKSLITDNLLNVEPIKYKIFEKELENFENKQKHCQLNTIKSMGN